MPLDPDLADMLELLEAAPPVWTQTPEEARRDQRAVRVDARDPATVPPVASSEDISVPGGAGEIPARVYRPDTTGPLPTVVMFHGGGWVVGDLDTHDVMARRLANESRAVVVSVGYRLAPEHPFPAAVEDAIASSRWAAERVDSLGGDGRLALAGDSAGGNLAAVVAQVFRDQGHPLAGQLLIYPATDFGGDYPSRIARGEGFGLDAKAMEWYDGHYRAGADPTDPTLSPLRGRLDGLAPAVVTVAEFDPLLHEGIAYAEALRAAGVPVALRRFDGMIHGFSDMGAISPAAKAAYGETCRLFRDLLHPVAAGG